VLNDLRHGIRMLLRSPGFTAVAVAGLAIGVGASTALFSVLNAVLLRPLPYRAPERLVTVRESVPQIGLESLTSPPTFLDWQRHSPVFESTQAYTEAFLNFGADGGRVPERVYGLSVTPRLLDALGVRPALGRLFVPEDAAPEARPRALVLSHDLWQRRFGGDPHIIGRTIGLGRVVGVLPSDFFFPSRRFELFRPMDLSRWTGPEATPEDLRNGRRARFLTVVARLKPGVGIGEARAAMDALAARLADRYPETDLGRGAALRSMDEELLGVVRPPLLLLQAAVVLLLVIAAANVANLQLVRSHARSRELATRAAVGATRVRLVRQLLAESLVLALLGGGAGLLLACWGARVIVALSPASVPRLGDVGLDGRVLVFSLLSSLAACFVSGLLPALRASRTDLVQTLARGGRGGERGRSLAQSAFAVVQLASSLVLLAGAGLLGKSVVRLSDVDAGFVRSESVAVDLTRSGVERDAWAPFYADLLDRVRGLPGVKAAGITNDLPLGGEETRRSFQLVGDDVPAGGEPAHADFRRISPGYFDAMGVPLRRGRGFEEGETGVAIVNQAFVRRFLQGREALGRQLAIQDVPPLPREIVGVVGDVRHRGLAELPEPRMYVTHTDRPWPNMTLVVRAAAGDPTSLVPALRREVAALDPDLPLANVKTIDQYVGASMAPHTFRLRLVGAFAATALVLAALGVYGVVAWGVARRQHEIGIRMAVGADAAGIVRLVLRDGLRLVCLGTAAGLAGAVAAARALASLLYAVSPMDPHVLGTVVVVLAGITLVACYIPARRASRLDPLAVTREGSA
jgi:putative ABC transport system permease protein